MPPIEVLLERRRRLQEQGLLAQVDQVNELLRRAGYIEPTGATEEPQ